MPNRDIFTVNNILSVSGLAAQSDVDTAQSVDLTLHPGEDALFKLRPRREAARGEATGFQFASDVHDLGFLSEGNLPIPYVRTQDMAFALAFAKFDLATSAAGTGYLHQFTPATGDTPSFYTAVFREGNDLVAMQLVGLMNNSIKFSVDRDQFAKLEIGALGTGQYAMDEVRECVRAAQNATELQIANSALANSLNYVDRVAMNANSCWIDAALSTVASNIITLQNSVIANSVLASFMIDYRTKTPSWLSIPAKIAETSFNCSNMQFFFDAKLNLSTLAVVGGHELSADFENFSWDYNNNAVQRFTPNSSGNNFATTVQAARPTSTISIGRQRKDLFLDHNMIGNRYPSFVMKGELGEFDTGHNYTIALYFPRIGTTEMDKTANGDFLNDSATFEVLQNSAGTPAVYAMVKTTIATFAG